MYSWKREIQIHSYFGKFMHIATWCISLNLNVYTVNKEAPVVYIVHLKSFTCGIKFV